MLNREDLIMRIGKTLAVFIIVVSAMSISGLALWLGGFQLSITGTTSGGTQPDLVTDTWTGNFPVGDHYHNSTYTNTDGVLNITFTCTDNTVSNATNCNWAVNSDSKVFVYAGSTWVNCVDNPVLTLQPGNNTIQSKMTIDQYACPSDAMDITLSGTI